jgi:hypothetical protein
MLQSMTGRPWTSGPKELLEHAAVHIENGTAFDCRIAMISVDNAVELAMRTYLGLPKRVRGSEGPSRRQLEEKGRSFTDLLDLLEEFGAERLDGVSLGDLEGYHRLRNTLYHDGNGVTVDPAHVDSYVQIARVLLRNLLDISIDEPGTPPPHSSLGLLVIKWGTFEQTLRQLAKDFLPKRKHEWGPVLGIVDGLIGKHIVEAAIRGRVDRVARARNTAVNGGLVPTDAQLRPLLRELDQLQSKFESLLKLRRAEGTAEPDAR